MNYKCCKFIALLFIVSQLFFLEGCKTIFVKDPQKAARKQQKKTIKEVQKNYNETLKKHYKNQDKATQRRMKKKYKKLNKQSKKKKSDWKCR